LTSFEENFEIKSRQVFTMILSKQKRTPAAGSYQIAGFSSLAGGTETFVYCAPGST
jgi:hypothetical protein